MFQVFRSGAAGVGEQAYPCGLHAGVFTALFQVALCADAQEVPEAVLPQVRIVEQAPRANGRFNLDAPTETGSRLGLTLRETPATVTVVERTTIEARGAQDTQEILRAVPGVTAHNAPGSIGVSYRGFSGTSLNQLFNGINVQYTIAVRPVDSWIYERVEVVGGPSSFLFGAGGVGGSINYITKLAERSDFSEAQLRLGSNRLKEASVGLNRRVAGEGGAGSHYARIDLNHRDTDGWTDGTHARATQLATSLLSDLGGGFTHTLAYEYQKEQVDRPYWGTPVLNPLGGRLRVDPGIRTKNYNSADGFYGQEVQWLRSVSDWQMDGGWQLKNTLYLYDALRNFRNVETYAYNAANTAIIRSGAFLQRHDQRLVGNRVDGVYKGRIGEHASDFLVGLDVSVNKQTRFPNSLPGVVSTVDPFHFVTENFFDIAGMKPGFNPDRDNKVTTTAVYLENRTVLAPAWSLVTALRHEHIALDLTNRRAVTAASPASFSRNYRPTTGRMGVVWDVAPGANLYVQYATAADPPSGVLTTASFNDVLNNSELTTGRQIELGSKIDFWEGKGTATVAAYRITRKNIATQDEKNSAVTMLVGEQSAKGVELALGLQPNTRLALQGNLTYVDARYEHFVQGGVSLAGRTPANTPSTVANVWASYQVSPQWTASAGVRHVSQVYANAANTMSWGGYSLLDLGVSWKLSRSMTLTGRIRNVADKIYAINVTNGMAYLGPARSADVTLNAAF